MTRRDEADRILATRLMRERLLAGKSREELGRALGISAQIIRAYEFGAERLPAKFITAAVRALGVPLRMLCFDEDQRRVGDTGQDPDAPTRLALLRPLSILKDPGFAQVAPLMKLWQETRGELTDDVDKTVSVCGLRHRTILVRQPFRSSRLITQHFGAGIMIMRPCEALLTTGRDFDQCHADREYASWRAAAYAETLSSRRLRVECLRASIRSIPKIALLTRYDRVLFPRRRRDGDLYALAVSLQREVPVAAPLDA